MTTPSLLTLPIEILLLIVESMPPREGALPHPEDINNLRLINRNFKGVVELFYQTIFQKAASQKKWKAFERQYKKYLLPSSERYALFYSIRKLNEDKELPAREICEMVLQFKEVPPSMPYHQNALMPYHQNALEAAAKIGNADLCQSILQNEPQWLKDQSFMGHIFRTAFDAYGKTQLIKVLLESLETSPQKLYGADHDFLEEIMGLGDIELLKILKNKWGILPIDLEKMVETFNPSKLTIKEAYEKLFELYGVTFEKKEASDMLELWNNSPKLIKRTQYNKNFKGFLLYCLEVCSPEKREQFLLKNELVRKEVIKLSCIGNAEIIKLLLKITKELDDAKQLFSLLLKNICFYIQVYYDTTSPIGKKNAKDIIKYVLQNYPDDLTTEDKSYLLLGAVKTSNTAIIKKAFKVLGSAEVIQTLKNNQSKKSIEQKYFLEAISSVGSLEIADSLASIISLDASSAEVNNNYGLINYFWKKGKTIKFDIVTLIHNAIGNDEWLGVIKLLNKSLIGLQQNDLEAIFNALIQLDETFSRNKHDRICDDDYLSAVRWLLEQTSCPFELTKKHVEEVANYTHPIINNPNYNYFSKLYFLEVKLIVLNHYQYQLTQKGQLFIQEQQWLDVRIKQMIQIVINVGAVEIMDKLLHTKTYAYLTDKILTLFENVENSCFATDRLIQQVTRKSITQKPIDLEELEFLEEEEIDYSYYFYNNRVQLLFKWMTTEYKLASTDLGLAFIEELARFKCFDRVRQLIDWRREHGKTKLSQLKEIVDEYFPQEELSQGAHAWYRDIFQALEEESHVATIRP